MYLVEAFLMSYGNLKCINIGVGLDKPLPG